MTTHLDRMKPTWLTLAAVALSACAGAAEGNSPRAEGGVSHDSGTDTSENDPDFGPPGGERGLAYDDEGLALANASDGAIAPIETGDCNASLAAIESLTLNCGASGCEHVASCCVGRGDCCGAGTGLAPLSPDWGTCVGDAASCASLTGTTFGSPRPTITSSGTFAPGGDGAFDSGLVLDSVVDLRSTRLELTVEFTVPTGCGVGCLEGAALSLSTQDVFDDATHVRVLAGLALSGSRGTVTLVVNDREVRSWPAADVRGWTLVLSPDGRVDVREGATSLLPEPVGYLPAAAARLVLFGHDQNPTTGHEVAGIRALTIDASRCDIPTRWAAHRDIALRVAGAPAVIEPDVGAMSTALAGDGTLTAALLIDGSLFTAQQPGTDAAELNLRQPIANPLLAPMPTQTFGPPTLHFSSETSGYVLLLPVEEGGMTTLMRSTYDPMMNSLGGLTPLLIPEGDIVGFSHATLATSPLGETALIVTRTHGDGATDLAAYKMSDGTSTATLLDGLHLNDALSSSVAMGFDADEIGGLSLTGTNHAWQLYYARRSGARWSIGLLVSDDLVYWRHAANGESVLRGDGSAHELVGVRSPAITIDGERVTLRYLGLDGSHAWPRVATRWATANGVWRD